MFDIFGSEESSEEKEDRFLAAQHQQLAAKTKNLRSVERQNTQDKQFLEQLGEEVPEEGRGWLPTILDTLDTPHQWVQGAIAKGTGVEGYKDLDWLGAMGKGSDEDLRTADILRSHNLLKDQPFLRGIAGFLGDVVTDPLQYATGIPQVAGIGGKALGMEALPTLRKATGELPGEMLSRIGNARFEKLMETAKASNTLNDPKLAEVLTAEARIRAEREARQLFEGAQSYVRNLKEYKRTGVIKALPGEAEEALTNQAKYLGVGSDDPTGLALQSVEDLSRLHKRPSIRFTSPFMGIPGIEHLPIIGTREADIPLVSDAVSMARDALSDGYYGAKLKVGNWVADSLADNIGDKTARKVIARSLSATGKGFDSLSRMTTGVLGGVSRRISSTGKITGPKLASSQIMQHERDRDALLLVTQYKTGIMARDLLRHDDAKDLLLQITRSIDSASDALSEGSIISAEQYKQIEANLTARIKDPAKLEQAKRFTSHIQAEYARVAQREADANLIENVRDIYLPHIYNDLDGKTANFAKERKYRSLELAKADGLKPNEDAVHLLTARIFASEMAFAQKDFAERMAFQHGLNPGVYQGLTKLAREGANEERIKALATLKQLGVVNNAELQIPAWKTASGNIIDGQTFEQWRDIAKFGDGASLPYQKMLEETLELRTKNGVVATIDEFLNDGNATLAETMAQRYKDTQRSIPGFDGESTFARAGATTIAPFLKQKMLNDITPGDETLWNNLVPNHLAHALEESYYVGDSLKRWVEKNAAGQARNGFTRAMDGALGFLGGFNKVLKQGALSIWPARYVRDLTGAGFQSGLMSSPIEQATAAVKNLAQLPLAAASAFMDSKGLDLGKHLNFHSIVQAHEVINGGKGLRTALGKEIPNQQLMMEAISAGFEWNGNYSTDLVASLNDMLEEMAQSPSMRAALPGVRKFAKENTNLTAVQKATKWAANKANIPLDDRFWQKFPAFGERLERYGRTHTFLNLRSRGFDVEEAADLANRMHIDYKNAKTPTEQKFLNNMFFFYSFSRGNASSLMTSLMKKPGALTTQLHAFHGIGEMLRDEDFVDDPDIEERVRSKRMDESMSMYLGKNEETSLPRFLSGSGLPVEDLSKFGAFVAPQSFSVREVMRSGAETMKRSGALAVGQANPFIKTVVEVMTGRNFFYDRPITDETLRKIPKWERDSSILGRHPFRAVPNEVYDALDEVTRVVLDAKDNGDGTWTVNPYNLAAITVMAPGLSSLAPGNPVIGALSPLKYSGRFLNTRRVLTEPGVDDRDKWLRAITGVHVNEIDPDASRLYDEKKDIQGYMDFIGVPKGKRRRLQMLQAETELEEEE